MPRAKPKTTDSAAVPLPSKVSWPADNVTRQPVAQLIPYATNARTHTQEQIGQIAASIQQWGWTMPVLVDEDNVIIAGHARVMAAQKLGLQECPVMVASGWSDAQKRAYVIADNKLSLNAGWDQELLKLELTDLGGSGFDMDLIGFSSDELAGLLMPSDGLTDQDDVPEAPAHPISCVGDVWILGTHRLMCGDSTNAEHVAELMKGEAADLCFTSPPYGQQRDYKTGGIADWDRLMQGVFAILPMKQAGQVLVNLGMIHRENEWLPYWDNWIAWMRAQGWRRFGMYVWDQGPGLPGNWNGRLAPSNELIFHFNKEADPAWNGRLESAHSFVYHFNKEARQALKTKEKRDENVRAVGKRTTMRNKDGSTAAFSSPAAGLNKNKVPDSVIRVGRQRGKIGDGIDHPAVFPVDLASEVIATYSDPGSILYEPFCGAGSQIISAQQHGRRCFGMELAPEYADVCVKRWQAFTGKDATLEETGTTFAGMSELRPIEEGADVA